VSLTASFGNSAQQFPFDLATTFVHFVIRCDLCDHILSGKEGGHKVHKGRPRTQPEDADTAFSTEKENKPIEEYKMCFEVFRKYKNVISGVTFWNVSDRHSWLDNFPVRGRKDHPLLFDKDLKPKKVFWEVVKF